MAEFFQVEEYITTNSKCENEYRESFINPDHILKITYDRASDRSYVTFCEEVRPFSRTMMVKGNLTELLIPTSDCQ